MGFNAVATRWVVSTVHVPATLVGKAKIVGKKVARTIVPTTAIAWILRATATRGGRASRATTKVRAVFIIHVGGTRCVTSSTDHSMKRRARTTLSVEVIRTCIFVFLFYV